MSEIQHMFYTVSYAMYIYDLHVFVTKNPLKCDDFYRTEYEFRFNEFFEIHDEIGILKKMGFCYGIDTGMWN